MYEILLTGEYKAVSFQVIRNDENGDYGWCTELNKEVFGNNYTKYNWYNDSIPACIAQVVEAVDVWIEDREVKNCTADNVRPNSYVFIRSAATGEIRPFWVSDIDLEAGVMSGREMGGSEKIIKLSDVAFVYKRVREYSDDELEDFIGSVFIELNQRNESDKHIYRAAAYAKATNELVLVDRNNYARLCTATDLAMHYLRDAGNGEWSYFLKIEDAE